MSNKKYNFFNKKDLVIFKYYNSKPMIELKYLDSYCTYLKYDLKG